MVESIRYFSAYVISVAVFAVMSKEIYLYYKSRKEIARRRKKIIEKGISKKTYSPYDIELSPSNQILKQNNDGNDPKDKCPQINVRSFYMDADTTTDVKGIW